jgi:uncharacterized protein YbjT (DUF2867 family)
VAFGQRRKDFDLVVKEKKVIAVVGATGSQGGGLVRAIVADEDGRFAARAITRHPESEKAKALAALGAEVIAADSDDPESLRRAFAGADGAYCMTNFFEHFSPEREIVQARNMARAAKDSGVAHVIWNTLDDTRKRMSLEDPRIPTLRSKYKVPHFDGKGEADRIFAEESAPTTLLSSASFWDNFIKFRSAPRRGEDGNLVLALPLGGARLPGIAAEDVGKCALAIFRRGPETAGRRFGIAGEILTGEQMADGLAGALGEPVSFVDVPFDIFRGLGFPGAEEIGNMYQYQAIFNDEFCESLDVELARALDPDLQSYETWLREWAPRLPID